MKDSSIWQQRRRDRERERERERERRAEEEGAVEDLEKSYNMPSSNTG